MKKILLLFCAAVLVVLVSCGETTTEQTNYTSNETTTQQSTTTLPSTTTSTEYISTNMDEYISSLSNPYNINLCVTEDLTTSMAINFEMPEDTTAFIEYSVSGLDYFETLQTTKKTITFDDEIVYLHEATMNNLIPGTTYEYRIRNDSGTEISDFYEFKTLDNSDDEHTIMFLADPQENSELGYKAYAYSIQYVLNHTNIDYDLVMSPGDLIQDSEDRDEWNWYFKYSSIFSFNKPTAATIGNHEMKPIEDDKINTLEFDGYFNLPNNGPTYLEFDELFRDYRSTDFDDGKTYSFDIGEAHIVVIDSETFCDGSTACIFYDQTNVQRLNTWIRNDLQSSAAKWKIVMIHRGPYGLSYNTPSVRNNLTQIMDDYNVDLVIAGHEHQYSRAIYNEDNLVPFARSNNYLKGTISLIPDDPLNLNFNNYSSSIGVTYLTSNTVATKFYGDTKDSEIDVNYGFRDEVPVIPIITITENSINVTSYGLNKRYAFDVKPFGVFVLEEFTITK